MHSTENYWWHALVPGVIVGCVVIFGVLACCRFFDWCCCYDFCDRHGCTQYRLFNATYGDRWCCCSCKIKWPCRKKPAKPAKPAYPIGDRVVVVISPHEYNGKKGVVVKCENARSYQVRFENGLKRWFFTEDLRHYNPEVDGDFAADVEEYPAHEIDAEVVVNKPGHADNGQKGIVIKYEPGSDKPYQVRFPDDCLMWFSPRALEPYGRALRRHPRTLAGPTVGSEAPRVHSAVQSTAQHAATAVNVTNHGGDEAARAGTNNEAAMAYPLAVGRLQPTTLSFNPGELKPTTAPATPVAVPAPSSSVDVPAERASRDDTYYGENEAAAQIPIAVAVSMPPIESDSRLVNFCGNCGAHRRGDDRFCVTCGKDLSL